MLVNTPVSVAIMKKVTFFLVVCVSVAQLWALPVRDGPGSVGKAFFRSPECLFGLSREENHGRARGVAWRSI